jgi:hypothetical protein
MVLNATFNNISVISWRSVLLVRSHVKAVHKRKSIKKNHPESAGSFITSMEHVYAVVLFGFSGHDAIFSLM